MQKHFFLSLLLLLFSLGICRAADDGKIGIKFERTGINAASVKVKVIDAEGQPIEGVTASLTSSHNFKNAGAGITNAVICPDVNGSSSPTINLTINIEGLPESISFDKMGLDIHALNGSGSYQQNSDGKARKFNVNVQCGPRADALTDFASLDNIDIAAGVGTASAVHKYWPVTAAESQTANGSLTISLTITKGTENVGCFFGLSGITVGGTEEIVETTPIDPVEENIPKAGAFYYITWFSNASQYMTETAGGALVVAGENVTERQFWQFIPTGKEHCYYVQNAATGHYIQSCNLPASSASKITMGTTPVEYYVVRNETAGAAVRNYFRLTSTDCDNYDNTDSTPRGLNKDGASSSVIAYHAGNTNNGSYWMLSETENLYELRPFTPSKAVGSPDYKYTLLGSDGQALEMDEAGKLAWQPRADNDRQAWYFVGESNNTEGYLIVNAAKHETVKAAGDENTRWHVMTDETANGNYFFRPFAHKDEVGSALTVAGDSIMEFHLLRSDFARAAQIYDLPCGVLGNNYLTRATIDGTGALVPLAYPLPALTNGSLTTPTAAAPSSWHTIYTQSAATVVTGEKFDLSLTLNAAPTAEDQAWVYFDWNRDGIFETAYELTMAQEMKAKINVPAEDMKEGRTRMRFRLTSNTLSGAEDDVVGQTVDFILNITDAMPDTYPVTVRPNDPTRGKTSLTDTGDGLPHVAEATPLGNASFICWKEGNRIVSVTPTYDFVRDHCIDLVACFSPNTAPSTNIGTIGDNESNNLIEITDKGRTLIVKSSSKVKNVQVYNPTGALVASTGGNEVNVAGITAGTYIVKVTTTGKNSAVKVYLK